MSLEQIPHADQPITAPAEDKFGVDPFALALANSIINLKSPNGTVVALNGPWGSGKSSAVNLIRAHLAKTIEAGDLVVINFDCWWFRGEDALALAFFRELYAGIAPSVGEKVKSALPKLGTRILKAGSAIGGVVDLLGVAGGAGAAVGNAFEWIGNQIAQDESVEKLHGEVKAALAAQPKRFLVIIDDIDRLSPDEALMMFRLVKSVGRLPNVMYLLVYDRTLAEKIVSERYPSEGPHYLEKIVQAAFELPDPDPTDLSDQLLNQIGAICGEVDDDHVVHLLNVFHEGIAPWIRTPRDVARYVNAISVTWPAVANEVNAADFLAMEALRLHHPYTYRAIRQNKGLLTGRDPGGRQADKLGEELERRFLGETKDSAREHLKKVLMRVFPSLEGIWGRVGYADGFAKQWAMERRACSEPHFNTYFRFSVNDGVARKAEIDELIARAGDADFIAQTFTQAVKAHRRSGGTRAAILLTELNNHATKLADAHVEPLLCTLFSVMDEIDTEEDQASGFGMANNEFRMYWLLKNLTLERFPLEQRSAIFVNACTTASLAWLAYFSESAWNEHHPREGSTPRSPQSCLTTLGDATFIQALLLDHLIQAANDGSLRANKSLGYLLYTWNRLLDDAGVTVKAWTASLMASDEGVSQLALAFTSYSWSQSFGFGGLGDLVAKRSVRAQVKSLDKVLDVNEFRRRVEQVSAAGQSEAVASFLKAWQERESNSRDSD